MNCKDTTTTTRGPITKRACDFCRMRKMKCDGESVCTPCQKRNFGRCSYDIPVSKRGPKKGSKRNVRRQSDFNNEDENLNENSGESITHNSYNDENGIQIPQYNLNTSNMPSINIEGIQSFSTNTNGVLFDFNSTSDNLANILVSQGNYYHPNISATTAFTTSAQEIEQFNSNQNMIGTIYTVESSLPVRTLISSPLSDSSMNSRCPSTTIDYLNLGEPLRPSPTNPISVCSQHGTQDGWPLSSDGQIDFVKLIMYLNSISIYQSNNSSKSIIVQSILNYLQYYHFILPMLDIKNFLLALRNPLDLNLKTLLNNFIILNKLTELNKAKVMEYMTDSYMTMLVNEGFAAEPICQLNWLLDTVVTKFAVSPV